MNKKKHDNSTINANNSTIVGGKENTITISNETKAVGIGVIANKITPLVDSALEIINKM